MGNDLITCFNGEECIYANCPQFNQQLDTCNFLIIGLLPTTENVSVKDQPQRKPEDTREGGTRYIDSLKEGEKSSKKNPINLRGTVVFDVTQKEVNTQYGPSTVTELVLKDDTGEAKLSFWGDAGDKVKDFVKDDVLFFEGLYRVKEIFEGKPQVDGGKFYKVAKTN